MPSPARPHSINRRTKKTPNYTRGLCKAERNLGLALRTPPGAAMLACTPTSCPSPTPAWETKGRGWRLLRSGAILPTSLEVGRFSGFAWPDLGPRPSQECKYFSISSEKKNPAPGQSPRRSLLTTSSPSPQLHLLTKGHRRALTVKGEITELPRVTFLAAKCC